MSSLGGTFVPETRDPRVSKSTPFRLPALDKGEDLVLDEEDRTELGELLAYRREKAIRDRLEQEEFSKRMWF
ncbi:MAG: hypothetical protein Q7S32_00370 [bacterium]|nr:hypothetical protein [bacterium]